MREKKEKAQVMPKRKENHVNVSGEAVVAVRMTTEMREEMERRAVKNALPVSLYARMLLRQAMDKIEQQEQAA